MPVVPPGVVVARTRPCSAHRRSVSSLTPSRLAASVSRYTGMAGRVAYLRQWLRERQPHLRAAIVLGTASAVQHDCAPSAPPPGAARAVGRRAAHGRGG